MKPRPNKEPWYSCFFSCFTNSQENKKYQEAAEKYNRLIEQRELALTAKKSKPNTGNVDTKTAAQQTREQMRAKYGFKKS